MSKIIFGLGLMLAMSWQAETIVSAQDASAPNATAAQWAAGVPRELAVWRAARYRDVRYGLRLFIAPHAEMLTGALEVRVTLDGDNNNGQDNSAAPTNLPPLVFDWRTTVGAGQPQARVRDIIVNGKPVADAVEQNEHLIIPASYLQRGENVVQLQFETPIAASGRAVTRYTDREDGAEYLYTLFVPSDASTVFPCFDQPDLKARFTLDATIPDGWKIISNGEIIEALPTSTDKLYRVRFQETKPISTYLFAFAAGTFAEIEEREIAAQTSSAAHTQDKTTAEAPPLRLFVRKSKLMRAHAEAAEVFRLHRAALKYFSDYFAQPFPFPKYDLIIIPEFAYGGMEHAGATFLREEGILFPTTPTANDFLSRAELMFHETAHQWFGDLVTMKWFDDLWLKEGFATFMAYKAIAAIMPEFNAGKAFYQRTKPAAYLTDVTQGTTPIYQEIPNLSAAKSAYGNIVYRKAPSFLKQAEFYLSPEKFQAAVQAFLKAHAYSNAEWSDLVGEFERATRQDLKLWGEQWIKQRGLPVVAVNSLRDARNKRALGIAVRQQATLNDGKFWLVKLQVLFAYKDGSTEVQPLTIDFEGERIFFDELDHKPQPAFVFANYEDYGYGIFKLDDASRAYVLENLGAINDDFLRALLWGSLWDSVRDAELAPADYLELALANLINEKDEVTAQTILGRVTTAFNRYLSDAQRTAFAPRLENLLRAQMLDANNTVGQRITYFRAYQNIATSQAARTDLKALLDDILQIPGVMLKTRDRYDLVTALMIRNDTDAPLLLANLNRREMSDDARRYAYAAGAARKNAGEKERYFTAYLTDAQLAESWIEASLAPFNPISHSDLTAPYLARALAALPQLKKTRKIFFINNWLGAFLGGQCSANAAATVRKFLDDNPMLDRDLRLKILENVDGLDRCVKIRARYAEGKPPDTATPNTDPTKPSPRARRKSRGRN